MTIAALTRALSPAEYGELAVLLVFSGLVGLAVVYVVLPGTMSWTLGASDEDEQGVQTAERTTAADAGVALFTGIALMVGVVVVVMVAIVVFQQPLSRLLIHTERDAGQGQTLVLLAAVAAIPASLTRMLANILRYAQRPAQYVAVDAVRPVMVMAFAIALAVVGGGGVGSVLLIYVASGSLGLLVAIILLHRDITPRFSPHDARMILRRGRTIAPVAVSNWVVLNGDTFFLAQFASPATVGTYRVATGIGRLGSYVASTFVRAWGPMTQGPLAKAMHGELTRQRANAATLKYYVLLCCWALVALSAFSGVLVRIAPTSYRDAAPLIPALAAVYMLRVSFILSYHGSERQTRRRWMFSLFGVAFVVFVSSCLVLIPLLGSWGAAIAGDLAYAIPTVVMLTVALRDPEPMPLSLGHVAGGAALAAATVASLAALGDLSLPVQVGAAMIATGLYPLLLILTGIVPRSRVAPLGRAMLAVTPLRRRVPVAFLRRLEQMDARDLTLIEALVRRREPVDAYAARHGEDEPGIRMHLVVALRRLSDLPSGHLLSASMSRFVLEDQAVVHHLALSKRLIEEGCDPRALDAVYEAARTVRAVPERAWPRSPLTSHGGGARRLDSLS